MKPLHWPALLFRQLALLALVAGVGASRFFAPCCCAFFLLALLCYRQLKTPLHIVFLGAVFTAGFAYGAWTRPERGVEPAWVVEASVPDEYHPVGVTIAEQPHDGPGTGDLWFSVRAYRDGVRVWAVVDSVDALPDRRLRLMLRHVTPVAEGLNGWLRFDAARAEGEQPEAVFSLPELARHSGPSLPGLVVLTWSQSLTPEGIRPLPPALQPFAPHQGGDWSTKPLPRRPVPGELIAVTLRLREIHSLRNPGLWQVDDYWAEHGAWHRAWVSQGQGQLLMSGLRGEDLLAALSAFRTHQDAYATDCLEEDRPRGYYIAAPEVPHSTLWREEVRLALLRALPQRNLWDSHIGNGSNFAKGPMLSATAAAQEEDAGMPPAGQDHGAVPQGGSAAGGVTTGGAILMALVLGDRYLMNSDELDLFASSTLSHSLALSGMHLGYVAVGMYVLVWLVWRYCPMLHRLPVSRQQLAVAAALLPSTLYVWLSGAPPSLVRAYIMLVAWGLLLWLRRPGVLLDGLVGALAVIALIWPGMLFDVSLQLSALAIASMVWCLPVMNRCASAASRWTLRVPEDHAPPVVYRDVRMWRRMAAKTVYAAVSLLGVSLGAQIVLLPLLVQTFGQYGLMFPLNLLWLPVLGAWVMPLAFAGTIAANMGMPDAAGWLLALAAVPCDGLMACLRWLHEVNALPVLLPPRPHWISVVGVWFLMATLPGVVMRRCNGNKENHLKSVRLVIGRFFIPGMGVLLCCVPFVGAWLDAREDHVRLRLLDVGQGQAVLVEWKGGRLLVDGGGSVSPRFDMGRDIVTATLAQSRWPWLSAMFATHQDTDHIQGLVFPLQHLFVAYYADNGAVSDNASHEALQRILQTKEMARHVLSAGDRLDMSHDLTLEVVNPPRMDLPMGEAEGVPSAMLKGNDASLVLRLVWKGRPLALLCGDIEQKGQRAALRRLGWKQENGPAPELTAEVLILPHHGAAGASLPAWYCAVSPKLALASCGYANQWHFPARTTREHLEEAGIPLLRTDIHGQIIIEWGDAHTPFSARTAAP